MSQPCAQAENIKLQSESIKHISEHLHDIKESMKEQTEIIRSVADQNARINALEKHEDRYQGNFTELYNRVREAEKNITTVETDAREATQALEVAIDKKLEIRDDQIKSLQLLRNIATCKVAIAVYTFVLTLIFMGTICDVLYHKDTVDKAMQFLWGKSIINSQNSGKQ